MRLYLAAPVKQSLQFVCDRAEIHRMLSPDAETSATFCFVCVGGTSANEQTRPPPRGGRFFRFAGVAVGGKVIAQCESCRVTTRNWLSDSWATKIHTHFPHAFNFLAVPCGARKLSTSPDLKA